MRSKSYNSQLMGSRLSQCQYHVPLIHWESSLSWGQSHKTFSHCDQGYH